MRLYYPVLLVAAVAIASTNAIIDGDGEERGFKDWVGLSKGASSSTSNSYYDKKVLKSVEKFIDKNGGLAKIENEGRWHELETKIRNHIGHSDTIYFFLRKLYPDRDLIPAIDAMNDINNHRHQLMSEWKNHDKTSLDHIHSYEWARAYEAMIKNRIAFLKRNNPEDEEIAELFKLLD